MPENRSLAFLVYLIFKELGAEWGLEPLRRLEPDAAGLPAPHFYYNIKYPNSPPLGRVFE